MARSPARPYTGSIAYKRPSVANLRAIGAARGEYTPGGGSVSYPTYAFSGPRTSTSGKRSYRDSRGRIRWSKTGKPPKKKRR